MKKIILALAVIAAHAQQAQAQTYNPQIPIEAYPLIQQITAPTPPPPVFIACMPDVSGRMVCH